MPVTATASPSGPGGASVCDITGVITTDKAAARPGMEVKYANETRLIPCVVAKGGGLNGGLAHPLERVESVKNLNLSSIMLYYGAIWLRH